MAQLAAGQQSRGASSTIEHVPGRDDILIRSTVDIPALLRDALRVSRVCEPSDRIMGELPIITFQLAPNHHWMTVVPCEAVIAYSVALLFERGLTNLPSLMRFPTAAPSRQLTAQPGLLTWNTNTKTLVSFRISDLLIRGELPVTGHTYQYVGNTEFNGFALVKSDQGKLTKEDGNWRVIWEAPSSEASHR